MAMADVTKQGRSENGHKVGDYVVPAGSEAQGERVVRPENAPSPIIQRKPTSLATNAMPKLYERLNALDRQFLIYEVDAMPMHIGGTAIFEGGALRRPDGGLDIDRIRAFIASRLPRIPRYRQVVSFTPFGRHIWLDDPHFNIEYHVRHTSLPKPGTEKEFKALCGRVFSQALDRSKPLWEVWIIDGVEGDRIGFISKVHHAMVDGVRSVDLIEALLTKDPVTDFEPAPRWLARRRPPAVMMMLDDMRRAARVPLDIARQTPGFVRDAFRSSSDVRLALKGANDLYWKAMRRPSETPFNQRIGSHRRFDWVDTELEDVKAVRRAFGGTINDAVLTTVSGGVRRFLEHRGINPEGMTFRVMAPVNILASTGKADELGNQVSGWMVPLPIAERDPRRALEIIQKTTARLKEEKNALGGLLLSKLSGLAPSTLLELGSRIGSRIEWRGLPFNMVVTNVPGPQQPLYLLGARMLNYRGTLPIGHYLGLGTVIVSYDGKLQYSFTADWDLLPDVDVFARSIGEAFKELRDAAR
jgi:diacylglycerol O-acyltransferase / wax synthase